MALIQKISYDLIGGTVIVTAAMISICKNLCCIKTHGSESQGQEEAGRTRRTSELFTRSTALKFVNSK